MSRLLVRDVMTRYVEFVEPGASVAEAAVLMGELDIGGLPVGNAEQIEGVITDRDILYRIVARGIGPGTAVRDAMSHPAILCRETDTLQGVVDAMAAHHVRRMPVGGADGHVVGWVTLADISRKLLVDSRVLQTALHDLTEAPPAA